MHIIPSVVGGKIIINDTFFLFMSSPFNFALLALGVAKSNGSGLRVGSNK